MSFIDFKTPSPVPGSTTGDTGFDNDTASILPISDSEYADQLNLRRPSEYLRARTDVIRDQVNAHDALQLQDRSMLMVQSKTAATPLTLTWDSVGGKFTTSGAGTSVLVMPTASAMKNVAGTPTENPHIAQLYYDLGGTTFSIRAYNSDAPAHDRHMWEGADNIFVTIYIEPLAAGHVPTITVTGSTDPKTGPVEIVIGVSLGGAPGTTLLTVDELIAAINNHASASKYLYAERLIVGVDAPIPPAFLAETTNRHRLYEFSAYGVGGLDAPVREITAGEWAGFPSLAEGDILALDFSAISERRANTLLTPIPIVHVSDKLHSNIGNNQVFPLVKIYNGNAHFFNGIVAKDGIPTTLEHDYPNRSDYAAHVLSTNPTAHTIKNIDKSSRPFIVVDAAGKGDYTSIAAAVASIVTVGGTIWVKNGSYSEGAASFSSKDISVIGESRSGVLVTLTAPWNFTSTTPASYSSTHTFESIDFRSTLGGANVMFTSTDGMDSVYIDTPLVFRNCVFRRLTNPCNVDTPMFYIGVSTIFEECTFIGLPNAGLNVDRLVERQPTTPTSQMALLFKRCYFSQLKQIWYNVTSFSLMEFALEDSLIGYCGYSEPGAGAWNYLVTHHHVSATATFNISRNTWRNWYSDASQCGGFCKVRGEGVIADNRLWLPPQVENTNTDSYMIDTLYYVSVQGNYISGSVSGLTPLHGVGGIRGRAVRKNIIDLFCPMVLQQYGISVIESEADIANNQVTYNTDADAPFNIGGLAFLNIGYTGTADVSIQHVSVQANALRSVPDSGFGIVITGTSDNSNRHVISNNHIYGAAASTSYGVHLKSCKNSIIQGNVIMDCYVGVYIHDDAIGYLIYRNVISNNAIRGGTVATSTGIYIKRAQYSIFSGNNITNCYQGFYIKYTAPSANAYLSFHGNQIFPISTPGVSYGFKITGDPAADYYYHLSGNSIFGDGSTTGLDLTNLRMVGIGGNMLTGVSTAYSLGGCTELGMKNGCLNTDADILTANWTT